MEIDSEQLTIPDTPYNCTIKMPSMEFQRIVRDLLLIQLFQYFADIPVQAPDFVIVKPEIFAYIRRVG